MSDDNSMPPPSPLKREFTEAGVVPVEDEMTVRYLQYECKYIKNKYKGQTWGDIIHKDYDHFLFLLSKEVARDSNTFLALKGQLKPEDQQKAFDCTRTRDTDEGRLAAREDMLQYKCSHRGRMHGKTWKEVRDSDYSYFTWAVANTMGRDTKSFRVYRDCLNEAEKKLVDGAPKGQVIVPKGLRFNKH